MLFNHTIYFIRYIYYWNLQFLNNVIIIIIINPSDIGTFVNFGIPG